LDIQTILSGQATHQGFTRQHNEDAILKLELGTGGPHPGAFIGLYVIADGVGGQDDGEVASALAINELAVNITRSVLLTSLEDGNYNNSHQQVEQALKKGVEAANRLVHAKSQGTNTGMGTTLAALLVVGNTAYIANVGDSRVYLLRNNLMKQVTADHSLVAEMVAAGEITRDEIYTHPRRNVITRCLGMSPEISIDIFKEVMAPSDLFVICSDGLWEMVRDAEIQAIVSRNSNAQSACEQLIETANESGGLDNISAIIIRVCGEQDTI